ncbi:putative lipopolysaccharide heptosyltransferase III [uncultured Pigmentiphaga sp.]|uniref:putative lipopolysaccharide heptosyltransferase III n=1 Tax=uncultured Pigmentiphaga sp. TaxID=340361 RepID=UPI0026104435|nr:putative lipopolysaccharide heptosyltransferase III [uncultured Pigmentiphaga sp.]
MSSLPAREPKRALVIALRYLGDVLLTTPLPRALRTRYPQCEVDMLVFRGTEGMLENNPDINQVFTIAERPARGEIRAMLRRLWRRYDLALIPQPGDKPHLFGLASARVRVGLVPPELGHAWWKRLSLRHPLVIDEHMHRVHENERVAALLGLAPARTVVPPTAYVPREAWPARLAAAVPGAPPFDAYRPYAVVHPSPRWRYKQWHAQGWRELLSRLHAQGLQVLLSGGPGEAESQYVNELLEGLDEPVRRAIVRVQGRLSLAELADLLRHASVYVGPDTATTHLAAACGTPTVALFGPTDPRQWGPSPGDGLGQPWAKAAPRQVRGNVVMLQEPIADCVPCQREGCDGHRGSRSLCMERLGTSTVTDAVLSLLQAPQPEMRRTPA